MRIVIVGSTGCGKTTLANQLSEQLQIPTYDLDYFYWLPNWQPRPAEEFQQSVEALVNLENSIISGNYSDVRDMIWSAAGVIIWLDYSFAFILGRLLKRTFQRLLTKQFVCNGNYETWQRTLSPQHSIITWLFKSYWRRKLAYPQMLNYHKQKGKYVFIYKKSQPIKLVINNLLRV